jgi:hypothetical protein
MTQKQNTQITRHVFRIPVSENDNISVTIDGQQYKVVNIGSNGVSILLTEDSFVVDQFLNSIQLDLGNETFNLSGKIVHISTRDYQLISGIEFTSMGDDITNKFYSFLQKNRKDLFSNL